MNEMPARELTPAERRRRIKKIKRKRRIRLTIVIVAFILLLCAVAAPVVALVVFRIEKIEVVGETRYTNEEVIAAAGIANGSSLLLLNVENVKKSVETNLPYIDTAKVEKQLPGTLVLTLTAAEKVYAFETGTAGYILTSSSFKVLETVAEPPKGATAVKCKSCTSANAGSTISFAGEGEDETLLLLQTINYSLVEVGLDGISLINLLDEDNIRLVYDSRLLLRLGVNEKIESKLSLAKKVIDDQNDVNPARYGIINLKIPKKAYFLPCEAAEVEADANSEKEIVHAGENGTEFTDSDSENGTENENNEPTSVRSETTTADTDTTTRAA